jgi:hypothetical protein
MAELNGPPIIPAGILNALRTFEQHGIQGPPITVEQAGPPIIPGNPVFGAAPATQIIQALFHETTTTVALLGQYMASSFATASDGGGGTLITDPPPNQQQFLTQPHA